MPPYNDTFLDNATTLTDTSRGVNEAGGGYVFAIILLFIFIIILIIAMKNNEFADALLFDSFICSLLAGALYAAKLLPGEILILPTIILIAAIILKKWGG